MSEGFQKVAERTWVRDRKIPIREIFTVNSLKGATYSAAWGFSLDFVPLFTNHMFKWKRTNKSARCDICIDPIDLEGDVPEWCSFSHLQGVMEAASDEVSVSMNQAIKKALSDFESIQSISDLETLFRSRSALIYRRFGFDNYVQVYLAWGKLLIALGAKRKVRNCLKNFI